MRVNLRLRQRQEEMRARIEALRSAPTRCIIHRERLVTKNSCAHCLVASKRAAWHRYVEKRKAEEAKREEGGVHWPSSLDPKYWP